MLAGGGSLSRIFGKNTLLICWLLGMVEKMQLPMHVRDMGVVWRRAKGTQQNNGQFEGFFGLWRRLNTSKSCQPGICSDGTSRGDDWDAGEVVSAMYHERERCGSRRMHNWNDRCTYAFLSRGYNSWLNLQLWSDGLQLDLENHGWKNVMYQ